MIRSITHDPDSLRCTLARERGEQRPTWILCRKNHQYPIADDRALHALTEQGRVRPDDYLVNPHLDACLQAKEMPALKDAFRKAAVRRTARVSSLLALALARFLGVST